MQNTILQRLPVMTGIVGWVAMAGGSAVVTYGLGRTLIEHFEAGGTLANFDVKHLHQASGTSLVPPQHRRRSRMGPNPRVYGLVLAISITLLYGVR